MSAEAFIEREKHFREVAQGSLTTLVEMGIVHPSEELVVIAAQLGTLAAAHPDSITLIDFVAKDLVADDVTKTEGVSA